LASPCARETVAADLVKSVGRPRTYTIEFDSKFVSRIENKKTPLSSKTMKGMIRKYVEIMQEGQLFPLFEIEVNTNGVRQHIYSLNTSEGLEDD